MEIRFVAPSLRQIDLVGTEVLACAVFSDDLPLRGTVGLIDWRLAARISRYLQMGHIKGELGEAVLVPGKPRIPFEKLMLFGAGTTKDFTEEVYSKVIEAMLAAMAGLKVRMAVVERPGRHLQVIEAARAVELLLAATAERSEQDVWTLVETTDDQKRIATHLAEERRRIRMR